LDAQLNDNTEIDRRQSEIINQLLDRIKALEEQVKKLQPGRTVDYDYDSNGRLILRTIQ
jgi:hypothetical protein